MLCLCYWCLQWSRISQFMFPVVRGVIVAQVFQHDKYYRNMLPSLHLPASLFAPHFAKQPLPVLRLCHIPHVYVGPVSNDNKMRRHDEEWQDT